jgi:hypothetical protein
MIVIEGACGLEPPTTMLYLVGAPGSGKSTVMSTLIDQLGLATNGDAWFSIWPASLEGHKMHNEFRGEPLEDIITGEVKGLYLGRNREEFPGTDAIGMASHSEAVAWMENAPELPPLILGEGARIGTGKFLTACVARVDLVVGYLTAPREELDERLAERWAQPTDNVYVNDGKVTPRVKSLQFLKGSETKAINAAAAARESGARVIELDTSELDPDECAAKLVESILQNH